MLIIYNAEDALLQLSDSIHKWYVIVAFTKQNAEPSQELLAPLRLVRE